MADDPTNDRDHIMELIHVESDRIDKETADWKIALAKQKANDKLLLAEKRKSSQQRLEESREAEGLSALPQSIRNIMNGQDESVSSFLDGDDDDDEQESLDFDAMVAGDPELQALMKQIHADNPSLLNEVVETFKAGELENEMQNMGLNTDTDDEVEEAYDDRTEREKLADKKEQLQKEWLHAQAILKMPDIFVDPFAHVGTSTGNLVAKFKSGLINKLEEGVAMVPAEKSELAKLLDDALESDGEVSAKDKKELFLEKVREREALKPSDTLTKEYMDYKWDVVEFGRAPPPDYSGSLKERHAQNILRAELTYKDMLAQGIAPTSNTLTNMVAVYGSGYRPTEALEVLDRMQKEHGLTPSSGTYRALAKTHILNSDVESALAVKDEMLSKLNFPDPAVYGLILESLSHRNMVVEALKLLEESAEKGVVIKDKHLRVLRGRCSTLGVRHPNLPADPKQWVHDMHIMRRNKRNAGERGIHKVKSKMFY